MNQQLLSSGSTKFREFFRSLLLNPTMIFIYYRPLRFGLDLLPLHLDIPVYSAEMLRRAAEWYHDPAVAFH